MTGHLKLSLLILF